MGANRPREHADRMLAPTVTELSRIAEPVVRDTFASEFDVREPRERPPSANLVDLASHRTRRIRPLAPPARAA